MFHNTGSRLKSYSTVVEQMTRNLKLVGSNTPEVENGREFYKKGSTINFF